MNSFAVVFVLQVVIACALGCGSCGGVQKGVCKSAELCCFPSRSEYYVNPCGVNKQWGPYGGGDYGYGPYASGYGYGGCGCGNWGGWGNNWGNWDTPYYGGWGNWGSSCGCGNLGGWGNWGGWDTPYYGGWGNWGSSCGCGGLGGWGGYGNWGGLGGWGNWGGCGCGCNGGWGGLGGWGYGPYDTYSYGGLTPFDANPFYPTQCGPERVIVENDRIICQPCIPKCNCAKKPIQPC